MQRVRHSRAACSVLLEVELLATSDETSSAGSDETTLLTAGSVSPHSGGVTHMLMVTTTMGMLDGVHSDTTDARPVLLLGLGLVVGVGSLEDGLVGSLATGHNTDHGSAVTHDGLADARGELDTRLLAVLGVTDHDGRGAGGASEGSTVTDLGLNVGDDGAFGHLVHGHDVADSQRSCKEERSRLACACCRIECCMTYPCFQRRRTGRSTCPRRR